jgi:hypothetical protein
MHRITHNEVTGGITSGGAQVLYPNFEAIKTILREVLDAN